MKRLILQMKSKSRALYRNKWSQWTLNNCKGCNMVLTIILRNTICKMRMMVKIALMRRSVQNTQRKTSYIQTSKLKKRVPSVCIRDAQSTFIDLMSSLWDQSSFTNMKRTWSSKVRSSSICSISRLIRLRQTSPKMHVCMANTTSESRKLERLSLLVIIQNSAWKMSKNRDREEMIVLKMLEVWIFWLGQLRKPNHLLRQEKRHRT